MGFGPILASGAQFNPVAIPMRRWDQFMADLLAYLKASPGNAAATGAAIQGDLAAFIRAAPVPFAYTTEDVAVLTAMASPTSPVNAEYKNWVALIAAAVATGMQPLLTYYVQGENHWVAAEATVSGMPSPAIVQVPASASRTPGGVFALTPPPALPPGRPPTAYGPKAGSTVHFDVYVDTALGGTSSMGKLLAQEVLASCERDYTRLCGFFGMAVNPAGTPPPPPPSPSPTMAPPHFDVYIDQGDFGAMHEYCSDTAIHCTAIMGLAPGVVPMMLVAEMVEVFAAAKLNGWRCRHNNGEGLSRTLAAALYPGAYNGFLTGSFWLNDANSAGVVRGNYLNPSVDNDTDLIAVGCAVLFINYLHSQLGYGWGQIVQAGGLTLEQTYLNLTGTVTDPFPAFANLLAGTYPPGTPVFLQSDNPFPI